MLKRRFFVYIVFSSAAFVLFHVFCLVNNAFFVLASVFFLLIAALSFIYPDMFSYALALVSWLALYPAYIFVYKIDPVNSALPILVFNCLQAGFIKYKNIIKNDSVSSEVRIEDSEAMRKKYSEELEEIARFENGIRQKELTLATLYEITKRLSEQLRSEDIFAAFSAFLKENFIFNKCYLLILDSEGPEPKLGRFYGASERSEENKCSPEFSCEKLIKLISENPREAYLSRDKDEAAFREMGLENKEISAFAVVPLLSESKVVGILAVENLLKDDMERFIVLSLQFALEIKKVLLYETVEKMAITDSLTLLWVRRHFSERLAEELQRSRRHKFEFAFLMMDIDDFKKCNDTYGHLVGDVVLKEIGRLIKENSREIDLASRYGGEEFALALPETGIEGARHVAERIRKKIEDAEFKAYDEKIKLTISIGIAVFPVDASDVKGIIKKSDEALYEAKRSGKNVVCESKR